MYLIRDDKYTNESLFYSNDVRLNKFPEPLPPQSSPGRSEDSESGESEDGIEIPPLAGYFTVFFNPG